MAARRPGLYERHVFPWLLDRLTTAPPFRARRAAVLAMARGRVLEIGLGTGVSLEHYPAAVACVVGLEPNGGMHGRSRARRARVPFPVPIVTGRAEALPFVAGTFDTVVSVLTLCSLQDPDAGLRELRRALRRDGILLVLDHGLSPEPSVATWQHRLTPLERRVGCGCELARPIRPLVEAAGFTFDHAESDYLPGVPRTHGWITSGRARPS